MIVDALLRFSNAQAVTAAAASTNVVDLSEARDIGNGKPLYVVIVVTTAFTDGGSNSTLSCKAQFDNDEAFGSVDTEQELGVFAALAAVGAQLVGALDPGKCNSRYMRLYYTPANGDLTTGSLTAFITDAPHLVSAYPDNVTITT